MNVEEGRRRWAAFDDPSALDLTVIEGYSQYQENKQDWRAWCDENADAMFDAIDALTARVAELEACLADVLNQLELGGVKQ